MAELKSWSIYSAGEPEEEIFFLRGAVFGHTSPHCKDGTYTRTTTIESMTDKGEVLSDEKLVHVGTFQDSVILDGCGVRYFPYQQNSPKFYNTLPVMLMGEPEAPKQWGYIYNSGSTPLRVKFTWGKTIEILPGETVPFDKDELEKYPDSELLSHDDLYPAIDISSLQNKS